MKSKWGNFKNTPEEHKSRHKPVERHHVLRNPTQDHEDVNSTFIYKINVIQMKKYQQIFFLELNNPVLKFTQKNKHAKITKERKTYEKEQWSNTNINIINT